ncbi:RNA ligase family protein [Polynucleobacter sp. UK-Kesae-W10]|uniref:RNA ligase family protein n=1 Tax=Polynucleobacter sp. UK-Kesae-W10 TaxID=1819738 RepID=UPI001C0E1FE6|nr:RNA ligase family protein [Polynucleobacter sp. UK-Kesae-W10]MBU3577500.1 hypothetical protein [Polynucleobacter sp. UK-Kesae-W10]
MSKLAVIGTVEKIITIDGADRIQQAIVDCGAEGQWSGVVTKEVNSGDKVVVLLQDALLPPSDRWAFMEKSKWRVRMARFKGVPSECVILPAKNEELLENGYDLTEILGITKYSKPIPSEMAGVARGNFPAFIPKTDESNYQRIRGLEDLMDGVDWYATAKIDGTSCTVWNDQDGLHVCSRNLELDEESDTGATNVYWRAARMYGLDRVMPGVALQFEIAGPGIQGNPMGLDEIGIFVFTAYSIGDHKRLPFAGLMAICLAFELPVAPIVGGGCGYPGEESLRNIAANVLYPNGKQAEGIVVRDVGSHDISFKVISLEYKD